MARMVGLLNKSSLEPSSGIWIKGCSSVHTIGMKFPIDLIFVDRNGKVLKTVAKAQANKLVFSCRGAKDVIEMGEGFLDLNLIKIEDILEIAT